MSRIHIEDQKKQQVERQAAEMNHAGLGASRSRFEYGIALEARSPAMAADLQNLVGHIARNMSRQGGGEEQVFRPRLIVVQYDFNFPLSVAKYPVQQIVHPERAVVEAEQRTPPCGHAVVRHPVAINR